MACEAPGYQGRGPPRRVVPSQNGNASGTCAWVYDYFSILHYFFCGLWGLVLGWAFLGHAGCDADPKLIGKGKGVRYSCCSAPTGCRDPGETGKLPGHAAQLTGRQAVQRELRGTGQRGGLRVRRAGDTHCCFCDERARRRPRFGPAFQSFRFSQVGGFMYL